MAVKKVDEYILVRHANRHVRKAPDKNAESLHVTEVGQKIPFLGKVKDGWYKVKIAGRLGWLYKSAGDIHDGFKDTLKIKAGNWHVRMEPKPKSKSLTVVNETSEVLSLGAEDNGWISVEANGVQGWLYAKAVIR